VLGKRVKGIEKESLSALQRYAWPGNVRELRNVVERALIRSEGPRLVIPIPPPRTAPDGGSRNESTLLVDVEREHIRRVLDTTLWRIRGAGGAAELLGMKPTTLETRMAKLGLRRQHQHSTSTSTSLT
jgi:DNA-binding NtrC family response regulator